MKNKKYIVSFLIPIIVLIIINLIPIFINTYGEEIILKSDYYMPRDSFRGEYISLNYDISKISVSKFKSETKTDLEDVEYVYVYLKKVNNYYDVDIVSDKVLDDKKLYIKARVDYISRVNTDKEENNKGVYVRLSYKNNKLFIDNEKKELLRKKDDLEQKIKVKIKLYRGYFIPIDYIL
ncbi:GDYXXLXY domain-containing protein [Peptostreptococcaceae bacterium AGR-M142]